MEMTKCGDKICGFIPIKQEICVLFENCTEDACDIVDCPTTQVTGRGACPVWHCKDDVGSDSPVVIALAVLTTLAFTILFCIAVRW